MHPGCSIPSVSDFWLNGAEWKIWWQKTNWKDKLDYFVNQRVNYIFRNNFIRNFHTHTFRGAYNLEKIDFSYNQFVSLNNSGLFKKNPNIREMRMNNNMISELKMKVISVLTQLEFFDAGNNRLKKITGGILSKELLKNKVFRAPLKAKKEASKIKKNISTNRPRR